MSTEYTNIGKSKINETPDNTFKFLLKDNSVKTKHIAPSSITSEKVSEEVWQEIQNMIDTATEDIQNDKYSMIKWLIS